MSFADLAVATAAGSQPTPGSIDPSVAALPQSVTFPSYLGQPGPTHTSANPVSFGEGLVSNFIGGVGGMLKGIFGIGEAAFHDVVVAPLKAVGLDHGGFMLDDVVKAMPHAIAHDYAERYGPLLHGHFGQFFQEMYQHPFSFLMDAATVATAGSAGAVEAGGVTARNVAAGAGSELTGEAVGRGLYVAGKTLVKQFAPIPGLKSGASKTAVEALTNYGTDAAKLGGTVESASKFVDWVKGHSEQRIDPYTGKVQEFYKLDPFQRWLHDKMTAPFQAKTANETMDTFNPFFRDVDMNGKPVLDLTIEQQHVRDAVEGLLSRREKDPSLPPMKFTVWKDSGSIGPLRTSVGGLTGWGNKFVDKLFGAGLGHGQQELEHFTNAAKHLTKDMPEELQQLSPEDFVHNHFEQQGTLGDAPGDWARPANGSVRRGEVFDKYLGERVEGDVKGFHREDAGTGPYVYKGGPVGDIPFSVHEDEASHYYHMTSQAKLKDIYAAGALEPKVRGGDKAWEDGVTEPRTYLGNDNISSISLGGSRHGDSAILRVKRDAVAATDSSAHVFHPGEYSKGTEFYSNQRIPISKLEYLDASGKWQSLTSPSASPGALLQQAKDVQIAHRDVFLNEFGAKNVVAEAMSPESANLAANHASVMNHDLVDSAGRPMGARAVSDYALVTILAPDGVTPESMQNIVDKLQANGDTWEGTQNYIDSPTDQGERNVIMNFRDKNGVPFVVHHMTPEMKKLWDLNTPLREELMKNEVAHEVAKQGGQEVDEAKFASDQAALNELMKGSWANVTEHLREERIPGFTHSQVLDYMDNWRQLIAKHITYPAIKNGWLSPTAAVQRMYLPRMLASGAEWNAESKAFTGGVAAMADAAMREDAGLTQPIYFPTMDAERMDTPTGLFARKVPKFVGQVRQDANLRRNSGEMLMNEIKRMRGETVEGSRMSYDPLAVYTLRARRAINMQTDVDIATAIARQGRILDPEKPDLAANEMSFSLSRFIHEMGLKQLVEDTYMNHVGHGATDQEAVDKMAQALALHLKNSIPMDGNPTGELHVALPKVMADRLNEHLRSMGARHGLLATVDKSTRLWKDAVLSWSPRWAVHHLISNGLMLKMQGGRLTDALRLAFPHSHLSEAYDTAFGKLDLGNTIYSRDYGKASAAAQKLVDQKWGDRVKQNGMQAFSTPPRMVRAAVHTILDAYRKAGVVQGAETVADEAGVSRTVSSLFAMKGTYETMARVGYDPELASKALDQMVRYQGDFQDLSPFAKRIIRPYVAPFYPFYRHIAKLTMRFPLDHPDRANLMRNLGLSHNDLSVHGGPPWLEGATPIGEGTNPGDTRYLSGNNPFNTLFGGVGGFFQSLSPLFQMGYGQATGRSVLTGKPYTAPDVVTPFGTEQQFKRLVGPDGSIEYMPVAKTTPSLIEAALQQIPQYNLVKDLVAGGQTYSTSSLFDALTKKGVMMGADPANPGGFGVKYPVNMIQELARLMGYSTYDYNMTAYETQRAKDAVAALKAYAKRFPQAGVSPTQP